MEYPTCPEGFILDWKEASDLIFFLQCRALTSDEIENKQYIDQLLKISIYVPISIFIVICISYVYSNERIYRVRKNSSQTDDMSL